MSNLNFLMSPCMCMNYIPETTVVEVWGYAEELIGSAKDVIDIVTRCVFYSSRHVLLT